jgi:hypothetical protein
MERMPSELCTEGVTMEVGVECSSRRKGRTSRCHGHSAKFIFSLLALSGIQCCKLHYITCIEVPDPQRFLRCSWAGKLRRDESDSCSIGVLSAVYCHVWLKIWGEITHARLRKTYK